MLSSSLYNYFFYPSKWPDSYTYTWSDSTRPTYPMYYDTDKINTDKDGNIIQTIAFPGRNKDNLEIEMKENYINLTFKEDKEQQYYLVIPEKVDKSKITATIKDGILTIVFPPLAEVKQLIELT